MQSQPELSTIRALDAAAAKAGVLHDIILMVDLGDLREGIMPQELEETVRAIADLKHIRLLGLGTNLTCYGGVIPTEENLGQLLEYNRQAEEIYAQPLSVISGEFQQSALAVSRASSLRSPSCAWVRALSWAAKR